MANDLSCPNCGAGYTLPATGNQVVCAYCGSRFLVPESVRPPTETYISLNTTALPQTQVDVSRWVKVLVLFIVLVTVVPLVCSFGAAICGVLAPFAALGLNR